MSIDDRLTHLGNIVAGEVVDDLLAKSRAARAKPRAMTEQEIADLEKRVADSWRTVKRGEVLTMLGEVRRLRTLPVVPSCGWCGHCATDADAPTQTFCDLDTESRSIWADEPPPDWCHLRARSER